MGARLLVAVVVIAAGFTGCASGPQAVEPPEQGPFVTVWWTCGFVPAGTICPHWQLDADGTFVAFRGAQEPGDGSVHADEDRLYNATREDVRQILETFGLYEADRNYTVELAYRGHATEGEIVSLLVPAASFYETRRHYEDPTIADAGTLNIEVESKRGIHISSAYTGDGDGAFDAMRDAFESVRDQVEKRLGVPADA